MASIHKVRVIIVLLGAICVFIALAGVFPGIWLPDLLTAPRWVEVDSLVLHDGRELHLFQKRQFREDPFYYTVLLCKGTDGKAQPFLLGVDEPKIWSWRVTHPSERRTRISLKFGRVFEFDWGKKELRGSERSDVYVADTMAGIVTLGGAENSSNQAGALASYLDGKQSNQGHP